MINSFRYDVSFSDIFVIQRILITVDIAGLKKFGARSCYAPYMHQTCFERHETSFTEIFYGNYSVKKTFVNQIIRLINGLVIDLTSERLSDVFEGRGY